MNESAFPNGDQRGHEPESGMTLRDYFAAKAMQALVAASVNQHGVSLLAEWAYQQADAMLKARESQRRLPTPHKEAKRV